jgi:hypothetical protein
MQLTPTMASICPVWINAITIAEPFRDEHGIAKALSLTLQILDRAKPALLAKETELIKWRRAFAFHTQTFRKEQQPAAAWNGGEGLSPGLVIDQDSDVVAIDRITAEKGNHGVGVPL